MSKLTRDDIAYVRKMIFLNNGSDNIEDEKFKCLYKIYKEDKIDEELSKESFYYEDSKLNSVDKLIEDSINKLENK